jgi:hypothetical protein
MPYREALKRFDSLDPRCVMEITLEVARLRGNPLTEAREDGEKFSLGTPTSSSASATLSARTLRKLRKTQYLKIGSQFLRLPDSNASLPIRIQAWI